MESGSVEEAVPPAPEHLWLRPPAGPGGPTPGAWGPLHDQPGPSLSPGGGQSAGQRAGHYHQAVLGGCRPVFSRTALCSIPRRAYRRLGTHCVCLSKAHSEPERSFLDSQKSSAAWGAYGSAVVSSLLMMMKLKMHVPIVSHKLFSPNNLQWKLALHSHY